MLTPEVSLSADPSHIQAQETLADGSKFLNTTSGRFTRWTHDHPLAAKVMIVVIGVFLSPILIPLLGFAAVAAVIQGFKNGYTPSRVFKNIYNLALSVLKIMIPPKHHMSDHVFTEGEYDGCTLKYEKDIPILALSGNKSPIEVGYAQGFLLAKQIQKLLERWNSVLWVAIPTPKKAIGLCNYLKKTIPTHLQNEMRGVVNGFNAKMEELGLKDRVTFDNVLLLHLIPDILHSSPSKLAKLFIPPHGCTTILHMDPDKGPVFGRNMDWPSLGLAGAYSFIVQREVKGKMIEEIAAPGLIGTITGMSLGGIALAMNVCQGKTENMENGLPSCIFNRMILDTCQSVSEVNIFTKNHRPIGPYHLTVADSKNAQSVHFYQGSDGQDHTRRPSIGSPLITTNCRYNAEGSYKQYFNSNKREENIRRLYISSQNTSDVVEEALKLPLINNYETVHYAVMYPKSGRIKLAFDNAFAGDQELQTIFIPSPT